MTKRTVAELASDLDRLEAERNKIKKQLSEKDKELDTVRSTLAIRLGLTATDKKKTTKASRRGKSGYMYWHPDKKEVSGNAGATRKEWMKSATKEQKDEWLIKTNADYKKRVQKEPDTEYETRSKKHTHKD